MHLIEMLDLDPVVVSEGLVSINEVEVAPHRACLWNWPTHTGAGCSGPARARSCVGPAGAASAWAYRHAHEALVFGFRCAVAVARHTFEPGSVQDRDLAPLGRDQPAIFER